MELTATIIENAAEPEDGLPENRYKKEAHKKITRLAGIIGPGTD